MMVVSLMPVFTSQVVPKKTTELKPNILAGEWSEYKANA